MAKFPPGKDGAAEPVRFFDKDAFGSAVFVLTIVFAVAAGIGSCVHDNITVDRFLKTEANGLSDSDKNIIYNATDFHSKTTCDDVPEDLSNICWRLETERRGPSLSPG